MEALIILQLVWCPAMMICLICATRREVLDLMLCEIMSIGLFRYSSFWLILKIRSELDRSLFSWVTFNQTIHRFIQEPQSGPVRKGCLSCLHMVVNRRLRLEIYPLYARTHALFKLQTEASNNRNVEELNKRIQIYWNFIEFTKSSTVYD